MKAIAKVQTTSREINQLQDNVLQVLIPAMKAMARMVPAPATAHDVGEPGNWASDGAYLYVCTATNTWRRVATAAW